MNPLRRRIRPSYLLGAGCIAAFCVASFVYTVPGLTAKAASIVIGYWAAVPFIHQATGYGFGFKKKRAVHFRTSDAGGHECCDAQRAAEAAPQLQVEKGLHEIATSPGMKPDRVAT